MFVSGDAWNTKFKNSAKLIYVHNVVVASKKYIIMYYKILSLFIPIHV